jgi:hypothetical protein
VIGVEEPRPVTVIPASDEVLLIDDIARLLKTSPRTIARRIRAGSFPFPQLPRIDKRARWSRVVIERILAGGLGQSAPVRPIRSRLPYNGRWGSASGGRRETKGVR